MILPGQNVVVIPNRCCLTGDTTILVGNKVLYLRDIGMVLKDGAMLADDETCVFPVNEGGKAAIMDTPRVICFIAPEGWEIIADTWKHPNGSSLNTRASSGGGSGEQFIFATTGSLYYKETDIWGETIWEHEGSFKQPSWCIQTNGGTVIYVMDGWNVRDCYLNGNIYEGINIYYKHPSNSAYASYIACNGETRPNLTGPVEDVKYFPFALDTFWSTTVWHGGPYYYWQQDRWWGSSIQIVDELVSEKTATLPDIEGGRVWDMASAENSSVYFCTAYDYADWRFYIHSPFPPIVNHRIWIYLYKLTWVEGDPDPDYDLSVLYWWHLGAQGDYYENSRFIGKSSLLWNWADNTWILTYHNYRYEPWAPTGWVRCFEEGVGIRWSRSFEQVIDHCCFGGGGIVLATSSKLYSLNRNTGVTEWEVSPPAGSFCSAPVSVPNAYFIGTENPNRIVKYDLNGDYVSERNTDKIPKKLEILLSTTQQMTFTFRDGNNVCKYNY